MSTTVTAFPSQTETKSRNWVMHVSSLEMYVTTMARCFSVALSVDSPIHLSWPTGTVDCFVLPQAFLLVKPSCHRFVSLHHIHETSVMDGSISLCEYTKDQIGEICFTC